MARSDDDTWLLALAALWVVGQFRSGFANLPDRPWNVPGLTPTTPTGTRMPETGEYREVKRVRTALDPAGFPELATQAITIVSSWEGSIADALRDWITLAPGAPPPDPAYSDAGLTLAAQMAFETRGGQAVYHYNVGNLHAARGDFYTLEKLPGEKFTVYLFPLQAAVAMAARIRRKWPSAWYALNAYPSLTRAYAEALAPANAPKYYTAPVPEYAQGLRDWRLALSR